LKSASSWVPETRPKTRLKGRRERPGFNHGRKRKRPREDVQGTVMDAVAGTWWRKTSGRRGPGATCDQLRSIARHGKRSPSGDFPPLATGIRSTHCCIGCVPATHRVQPSSEVGSCDGEADHAHWSTRPGTRTIHSTTHPSNSNGAARGSQEKALTGQDASLKHPGESSASDAGAWSESRAGASVIGDRTCGERWASRARAVRDEDSAPASAARRHRTMRIYDEIVVRQP
jgi:hypothetical protein